MEVPRDYNFALEIRNLMLRKIVEVGQDLPDFKPVEIEPLLFGACSVREAGTQLP